MNRLFLVAMVLLSSIAGVASAQPVPTSGLKKVTHDSTLTGAGTLASALGLAPCGSAGQTWVWNGTTFACGSAGGTVTNVDTLAPLQGGPITTTGTVSLTLCPTGQIYKAGASSWGCAADAGITGTLTSGDLVAATGTGTVGNYAGSSPAACTTGNVTTGVSIGANGALTNTCTAIGTQGGITGGSLTANQTIKATGATSVGNGWAADDGTTWGVAGKFAITEATGATSIASLSVGGSTSLSGLSLTSHPITNVTDPTSAQDAATKNYVDTANTNQITGTLTSGTVPVATGAHTAGDSDILDDTATHTVTVGNLVTSTTGTDSGFEVIPGTSTTDVFLDAKAETGKGLTMRIGAGTSSGRTTTWLTVDGIGRPIFPKAVSMQNGLAVTTLPLTVGSSKFSVDPITGHAGMGGTAPTLSTCGTSPTITGTDTAGLVTLGTGSSGNCTITFANAYSSTPACVITLTTGGTASMTISARSAGAFTVHSPTDTSVSTFSYVCIGNPN